MRVLSSWTCSIFGLCSGIIIAFALPSGARAGTVTACTAIDLCYCVNTEVRSQIDANVARVRQLIAEQRKQDKAIGYMSIPLSTAGGSYFGVNTDVAAQTKDNLEKRLGANSAWILNPGGGQPAAGGQRRRLYVHVDHDTRRRQGARRGF